MFDNTTACFAYRKKSTGQSLVVLWDNSAIPDDAFVTRPAQVVVKGMAIQEPVWVDLISGRVYELPSDRVIRAGEFTIMKDVPLYDAPVLIAERSTLPLGKAQSGRANCFLHPIFMKSSRIAPLGGLE
jgi:hypothetical protein